MAIDPKMLMALTPLLQQLLQASYTSAPNVTNALQNGYDTGIMNKMFQTLYNKQSLDNNNYAGVDALQGLDNFYSPRELIPENPASSSAEVFNRMFAADDAALNIANQSINNTTNADWLNNSSDDDFLDMLWKRNNGGPMYKDSNKYIYGNE